MSWSRTLTIFGTLVWLTGCSTVSEPTSSILQTVSRDGTPITYSVHGKATRTLVFVHGWSCDRSYWKHQIDAFATQYTVIAVDLAGHGDSGATRDDWTIEAFAADVAAVIRAQKRDRVILVGHSMGGPVVLDAARQLGATVVGLVGVDTLQSPSPGLPRVEATQLWSGFETDFPTQVNGFVRGRFFLPDADPALVDEISKDMSQAPPGPAMAAGIGLSTYNTQQSLIATRDIPLVLLNATLQPTDVQAYQAIDRDVDVHLLKNNGHFPMLETPDAFNRTLREHIAGW